MATNPYLYRIPVRYRFAVRDFYKDADGWWICLDSQGPFVLDGYASDYTVHEDTQAKALAEFRLHIRKKEGA